MPRTLTQEQKETTGLDFQELESLRLLLRQILQYQVPSLDYFASSNHGFKHTKAGEDKASVSSTATCVLSLVATGKWKATKAQTKALLETLIFKKTSAGLDDNNPFTIAWILEAVSALEKPHSDPLSQDARDRVAEIEEILRQAVKEGDGGVRIDDYPPSAYLTQLVVRSLRNHSELPEDLDKQVKRWAWAELPYQLTLVQANSKTADPFAVAYLLMLVAAVTPRTETSPEQTQIQRSALKAFFDHQLPDGTWPLSRPLFHYKKFGNAYCYEYEMLTQLLQEPELEDLLIEYLPRLRSASEALQRSVYRVKDGVQTWASGHHPQLKCPESWVTASVFHYAHVLNRLLAEAVRRELFTYLEVPYPRESVRAREDFAKDFLDSKVSVKGKQDSLKEFLLAQFVKPLADEVDGISKGRPFGKRTPRSAIFFGPPGTSKTQLSEEIAKYLGWPYLAIDPSILLRNGMDGIQAEANAIFHRLEETEGIVVLFDEFDELVRERGFSDAEAFSRFLTTAMLPKLASIHKRATLVFIIATNNIGDFDLAIRRQGRFDHVVQIMPPTYKAKIGKKDWGPFKIDLRTKLVAVGVSMTPGIRKKIGDLTFGECDDLAAALAPVTTRKTAMSILADHWSQCTLNASVSKPRVSKQGKTTWAKRSQMEAQYNR
jgi:hypothetical protein